MPVFYLIFFIAAFAVPSHAQDALIREQIRVVGSSTVFPFVAAAAEQFGLKSEFPTPIIESTGTGGGMKLFCSGLGERTPDLANASRAIKSGELALCEKNGVQAPIEIRLGYDGIALANEVGQEHFDLTKKQIFLALARDVPNAAGELVENPYTRWNEIDAALPDQEIVVYGPPPTSGTRDAFVELVMEEPCVGMEAFKAEYANKKTRKKMCHVMREDGVFVEAGENDNLIIQKLRANKQALGIFGFSFLEQNSHIVQGSLIKGIAPTFEAIASGEYGVSRSLFVYAKREHVGAVAGLKDFLVELTSEAALDAVDGYLIDKGLIPAPIEERNAMRDGLYVDLGVVK